MKFQKSTFPKLESVDFNSIVPLNILKTDLTSFQISAIIPVQKFPNYFLQLDLEDHISPQHNVKKTRYEVLQETESNGSNSTYLSSEASSSVATSFGASEFESICCKESVLNQSQSTNLQIASTATASSNKIAQRNKHQFVKSAEQEDSANQRIANLSNTFSYKIGKQDGLQLSNGECKEDSTNSNLMPPSIYPTYSKSSRHYPISKKNKSNNTNVTSGVPSPNQNLKLVSESNLHNKLPLPTIQSACKSLSQTVPNKGFNNNSGFSIIICEPHYTGASNGYQSQFDEQQSFVNATEADYRTDTGI